jgi:N-acetylmuramic acid 6-phosphate etherase
MAASKSQQRALDFLRVAHLFRLGHLPTERPHPATRELSRLARTDPAAAVSLLKSVDLRALSLLQRCADRIDELARSIERTLARGHRIFLCGCGATGRLSLTLETLWRQAGHPPESVVSFMAGGDVALVHSLEGFEDHPQLGSRHLTELGFADGDLLIASTEGGETPYVIGATLQAAEISSNPPYFLYCNTDSALLPQVERFRQVHDHSSVRRICLHVGPMALAGSTRMQASTVLQLAIGAALLHPQRKAADLIRAFRFRVETAELSWLADFVERESEIYRAGHHVHYQVRDFGITVFTDTTERAPTFSLAPFEPSNGEPPRSPSLCYISLTDAETQAEAWSTLLGRSPRSLNWLDVDPRTGSEYLDAFDFSTCVLERRRRLLSSSTHHEFHIEQSSNGIRFELDGLTHEMPAANLQPLFQHLLLKQVLNIHSTLVMGRLGRYESNLMTWVSPTNGKLVDRAVRYVRHLVTLAAGSEPAYDEVVLRLFAEMERMEPGESVVLRTVASVANGNGGNTCGRQQT